MTLSDAAALVAAYLKWEPGGKQALGDFLEEHGIDRDLADRFPTYRYQYLTKKGTPRKLCPECRTDLREDGNVEVFLCDDDKEWSITTSLLEDGYLWDWSGDVADGCHSSTCCNSCGLLLVDWERQERLE